VNDIAAVCCYYGKLPEYFSLWAYSAGKNDFIDFFLFTDEETIRDYPSLPQNVRVKILPFGEVKNRIKKLYGKNARIQGVYKLCDYKFAYGEIFAEELKNYRFFGWYDVDTILGDFKKYITEEALSYDVIGELGHFTLIKNSLRSFFRDSALKSNGATPYKKVFSTDKSCFFDELYGLNKMSGGIKKYSLINYVADVDPTERDFYVFHKHDEGKIIIEYDGGKVYKLFGDGKRTEAMYAHLQKRKLSILSDVKKDKFYITPNGFSSSPEYGDGGDSGVYEQNSQKLIKAYAEADKINKRAVFFKRVSNKLSKIFKK